MSDYIDNKKRDGKETKTHIIFKKTFRKLLYNRSFSKISVNDLCEEALVSRSTFYVYFDDKYDLLRHCMDDLKKKFDSYSKMHTDKEVVAKINDYIYANSKLLKNLLKDLNSEVVVLLMDLLSPSLSNLLTIKEKSELEMSSSHVVLANFCAGGIINLLLWQVKNDFPIEKELMSNYLYNMQKGIEALDLAQNFEEKEV